MKGQIHGTAKPLTKEQAAYLAKNSNMGANKPVKSTAKKTTKKGK